MQSLQQRHQEQVDVLKENTGESEKKLLDQLRNLQNDQATAGQKIEKKRAKMKELKSQGTMQQSLIDSLRQKVE